MEESNNLPTGVINWRYSNDILLSIKQNEENINKLTAKNKRIREEMSN